MLGLPTLAKVIINPSSRPVRQIHSKMLQVRPWPMLHVSTKFHKNRVGGFYVILFTTNKPY